MGKDKFNPDIEEFISKYAEVGTWINMASYYGVEITTIRKFAKEIGLKSNRRYYFTDDEINYIVTSRSNGACLNKLAEEFGCSRTVISSICKKDFNRDKYYKRKYKINENKFEIITKESAYFLGLIASDGCLYHHKNDNRQDILRITLQKSDEYILKYFADFLETTKPLIHNSRKRNGKLYEYSSLEISSNKIVADIIKLGIGFRKTYKNCIPNIPIRFMPHFIRGYFDGDGSIYVKRDKESEISSVCTCIAGFYKNLHKIKDVLKQFNILFEFQEDKRKNSTDDSFGSLLSSNKTQSYSFLKLIYYDCDNLYLIRKYEEAYKYCKMIENSNLIRDKQIVLYCDYAVHTKIRDMCE